MTDNALTIALSKGRIFEETLPLLAAAGIVPAEEPEKSRKLIIGTNRDNIRLVIVRATDVPTYVQYGAADFGIAGKDVLIEHGGSGLYQPLDLQIAKCRMMVAVRKGFDYAAAKALETYNKDVERVKAKGTTVGKGLVLMTSGGKVTAFGKGSRFGIIHDQLGIAPAIEDVEAAMKGMLKPIYEEVELGSAEIRQIFRSSKFGSIAGSIVRSGTIKRGAKARLVRDGVVINGDLSIETLRREKDDVTEVREGYECGINLGSKDIAEGDVIETWEMREKPRD